MESVYLETTIVGHLAGRMHPDPFVAAKQQSTRNWWISDASKYNVFISQLVIDECSAGDPIATAERLLLIKDATLLQGTIDADALAASLIAANAIPASEPRDALHIAIAAVHGVNYILTLNFRHIANATLRRRIQDTIRAAGFSPPTICTPDELMGIDDGS